METVARIDPELVQAFVGKAHGDLTFIKATVADFPAIVNAAWDWGGGDWETALGAAAHMGRRDIAEHLIIHGARLDIYAAAMLGYLEVVQAIAARLPATIKAPGPHGIPLVAHAKAGGPQAAAVVSWLLSQS